MGDEFRDRDLLHPVGIDLGRQFERPAVGQEALRLIVVPGQAQAIQDLVGAFGIVFDVLLERGVGAVVDGRVGRHHLQRLVQPVEYHLVDFVPVIADRKRDAEILVVEERARSRL